MLCAEREPRAVTATARFAIDIMGVPAFYRWLSEKYPKIVVDMLEDRAVRVGGTEIPLDLTASNPNGIEVRVRPAIEVFHRVPVYGVYVGTWRWAVVLDSCVWLCYGSVFSSSGIYLG